MATKKSRGDKGSSGEGKAAKASEPRATKKRTGDPSVTTFLQKLGGAPSTKGRATPAKGLLGDLQRSDLVDAGRIAPTDVPSGLDTDRTVVHVEVSTPRAASLGRKEERRAFQEHVQVRSVFSGTATSTRTVNLSGGGVFVETTAVLEVGDPVMLSFAMTDGGTLTVSGRVRWVTPFGGVDDAVPGMGISFVGLDEAKRHRLERMLKRVPRQAASKPTDA